MLVESTLSAAAAFDAASDSGANKGSQGKGARILVVDDNADAADLLGETLERSGYDVRVVYEGHSALALVPSFRPDLALLDIGLPGMNGYELAIRLHALEGLQGLKCIAITGYGHADDRRRAEESGFEAHILKPIDMPSLESALRRLLP